MKNTKDTTQRVYLWGAGDGAVELVHFIDDINRTHDYPKFEVIGLVGLDGPKYPSLKTIPFVDIGSRAWQKAIDQKAGVVITTGVPQVREKMFEEVKGLGLELLTVIHPLAAVSRTCRIAEGCIIGPHVTLSYEAALEPNCYIGFNASIGHHTSVGMHSVLSPGSRLGGSVRCGKNFFSGLNAVVIPRMEMGSYVTVSAGALVAENVPDRSKVIAVKSRIMRI